MGLQMLERGTAPAEAVSLSGQVFHHGVQIRRHTEPGRASFGVIVEQAPTVTFCGARWSLEELAFVRQGELDVYAAGAGAIVWLDVAWDLISGETRERLGVQGPSTLRTSRKDRLADLRFLCATSTAASEHLVSVLNVLLADADVQTIPAETLRRYELVREAEAFMWRHAEDQIDLASVAAALGCSVRKLLYYFKRTYGLGPIGYFKTQRLNAVRAVLQSDRTNRPILDVAADFGFWHMGHFGTDYKSLFGVTPSQTRRESAP